MTGVTTLAALQQHMCRDFKQMLRRQSAKIECQFCPQTASSPTLRFCGRSEWLVRRAALQHSRSPANVRKGPYRVTNPCPNVDRKEIGKTSI